MNGDGMCADWGWNVRGIVTECASLNAGNLLPEGRMGIARKGGRRGVLDKLNPTTSPPNLVSGGFTDG